MTINPEVGEIYKVQESPKGNPGYYVYVEATEKPEYFDDKEGYTFVTTRTPYVTSMYGQIEMCGFIETSKLELMRNNKKDRGIRDSIKRAIEKGIERSEVAYKLAKMREIRVEDK